MVHVIGNFMGCALKTQKFGDQTRNSIIINIFVPDTPSDDKLINVKVDDITRIDEIRNSYKVMDPIHVSATLYPSKNQDIYYTLVEFEPTTVST